MASERVEVYIAVSIVLTTVLCLAYMAGFQDGRRKAARQAFDKSTVESPANKNGCSIAIFKYGTRYLRMWRLRFHCPIQ